MGNITSICIQPEKEKQNTTLYAEVDTYVNKDHEEWQPEKVECSEVARGQPEHIEFTEIPHEEAKSAAVEVEISNDNQYSSELSRGPSRGKEENPITVLLVEEKPRTIEVTTEVVVEKPFLLLDNTPQVEYTPELDFDKLKKMHKTVESASNDDIKIATSTRVSETEKEFNALDFNEYEGENTNENYELPPVFFRDSGDYYHGNWNSNANFEGRGYLIRSDGSKYEGIWKNGELVWGRIYYKDGAYYKGKVSASQPHDLGELHTKDRKIFKGNFEKGELTDGTIQYENTLYQGQVWNGVPHGKGEYNDSHYTYTGEWARGKRLNGRYSYPDGTVYEGQYSENIPSNGKFTWKNGSSFEGDFINFAGVHDGIYDHPNGTYYGQWNGYLYQGKGIYKWKNEKNNKYEGEYKQGKKEGKGIYYVNSTDYFKATWKAGKPDGDCEYVTDGRVIKNRWRKGNRLDIISHQVGDENLLNFDIQEEVNNLASLPHLPHLDESKAELHNRYRPANSSLNVIVNAIPNTN
jgi:hypothetical protein